MGSRVHPMPGEPFCGACHASDDTACTDEHQAWCFPSGAKAAVHDSTCVCWICLAQLRTERDQARAELAREKEWHDSNVSSLHDQSHPRDLGRIATLEAALRKHGRHEYGCCKTQEWCNHEPKHYEDDCTCGLDAALATPGDGQEGSK